MDQMDIDPLPSRPAKHAAASPPTSSSTKKRIKLLLPDEQLKMVNSKMTEISRTRKWKLMEAEADDSGWSTLLEDILMDLTEELATTDMQGSVIANLTRKGVKEIVKRFKKDELEQWKVGVRIALEGNDWSNLIILPSLKILNVAPAFEPTLAQANATKDSWERAYHGNAAQALWTHIKNHYDPKRSEKVYARFCSVVQSSGMGKSRTVDELGKKHFSIPINLRDAKSSGYPPADHEVRNFLTNSGTETESYHRACCFIDALFQHTSDVLKEFDLQWTIEEVAAQFRTFMTEGQTMKVHNEFRRGFYQQVVQLAGEKRRNDIGLGYTSPMPSKETQEYTFPPAISCHNLVESLKARIQHSSSSPVNEANSKGKSKAGPVSGGKEDGSPLVILAFDEAHTLTNQEETDYAKWSKFSVLRHVFRALFHFPLFTLFLSTTSKISQLTSSDEDTSKRISIGELILIQPFTDLGFDTLARRVALRKEGGKEFITGFPLKSGPPVWNLEQITADEHIVHLGRPLFGSRYDAGDRSVQEGVVLFAVDKLLNADRNTQNITLHQRFACLSQRLPIQFNSTTYISRTAERKQVEGHMRVCLKIDAAFESMDTVSPSEPLLSEASYVIMARESFDPLNSFKSILEGFAIHKGDRGEFLALLLLTLARDKAVGPPDQYGHPKDNRFFGFASFMYGHLFRECPSASGLQQLHKDFPSAKMHFNHFIKLHDFKSIDKECLLLLMTRGAGVLCANNNTAIDAVNGFLRSGTELSISNLGLVLHQIKNDSSFTHNPKPEHFEHMDPYKLGILKAEDAPVPLIRIFFALAAKSPSLHVTRHEPSVPYNAVIYDVWSAGLSTNFLGPIDAHSNIWSGLLQASYGWQDLYRARTDVEKELRRSENPGAANDGGHWSRWAVRDAQ